MAGGTYRGLTVLSRGVPMVALRGNELIRFHSASPGTILGAATITGLQPGETARRHRHAPGRRPALWRRQHQPSVPVERDHRRGHARSVPVFPTLLSGTRFGVDFNPMVDRLRVVSDAEQNLRINPNNGAIAGVDTALNPAGHRYRRLPTGNNVDGAGATRPVRHRRRDRSVDASRAIRAPTPASLIAIGPLGVNTSIDVGVRHLAARRHRLRGLERRRRLRALHDQPGERRRHADRHDRHRHGDQRPDGDAAGLSVRRRRDGHLLRHRPAARQPDRRRRCR